MAGPAPSSGLAGSPPPPELRAAVRDVLSSVAGFNDLAPDRRKAIAQGLVRVCRTAMALAEEAGPTGATAGGTAQPPGPAPRPALARAQSAGSQFSGIAADRMVDTTRRVLNAVSFPRFVTDLINGVFKALIDSNQTQLQSFVDLIQNVAASTDGFADANLAPVRARQWLIDRFPGSFVLEGGPDPSDPEARADPEALAEARVQLKDGASMPSEEALRTGLGLDPEESVPSGDPETSLLPFARRALARQRQQMLGTMVMLGLQRIVIESGRLNAAMRFHIDTRSAAASDSASRFDFQNQLEAKGSFGYGPWGAEAKMTNTIGYVSTQRDQTTEEMNTDLDLNSSVELYFKTDYLPLDRLAGKGQVDRIKVNTLNPDAEMKAIDEARTARIRDARESEAKRAQAIDLQPRPPAGKLSGSPGGGAASGSGGATAGSGGPASKPAGAGASSQPGGGGAAPSV